MKTRLMHFGLNDPKSILKQGFSLKATAFDLELMLS